MTSAAAAPDPIERGSTSPTWLVLERGEEVRRSVAETCRSLGVDGAIRVPERDYASLPTSGLYAHFNLECARHVVGKRYALARIVRGGFFCDASGVEELPLLSFDGARIGRCVALEERIPYESLRPEHFAHSHPRVRDAASLRAEILARYGASLPCLDAGALLARGVARTLIEIDGVVG